MQRRNEQCRKELRISSETWDIFDSPLIVRFEPNGQRICDGGALPFRPELLWDCTFTPRTEYAMAQNFRHRRREIRKPLGLTNRSENELNKGEEIRPLTTLGRRPQRL